MKPNQAPKDSFGRISTLAANDAEIRSVHPQSTVFESETVKEGKRFKLINESFPKIGEQILQSWGKPGLIAYINGVIDDGRNNPALVLTTKVVVALYGLRKEHDRLYGRQAARTDAQLLTENEDFKTVNAQFQRIGKQMRRLWGGPQLGEFVNKLLQDTRDGTRQGFPPQVAGALFKLLQKHDQDFPEHALKVGDIWTDGNAL